MNKSHSTNIEPLNTRLRLSRRAECTRLAFLFVTYERRQPPMPGSPGYSTGLELPRNIVLGRRESQNSPLWWMLHPQAARSGATMTNFNPSRRHSR